MTFQTTPEVDDQWAIEANCLGVNPDIFFPEALELSPEEEEIVTAEAKAVCQGCLVAASCLQYALDQGPDHKGIWGGTIQEERLVILGDKVDQR